MTEDGHLLAGLLARPDDGLRWAVYADWLIDHGRPEEAACLRLLSSGVPTFATGSRVYGTPRADSDYDFVVYASQEQADALTTLAPDADLTLRAGPVNLIVFTNASRYCAWREATDNLIRLAPVSRQTAVDEIDRRLALRGLT